MRIQPDAQPVIDVGAYRLAAANSMRACTICPNWLLPNMGSRRRLQRFINARLERESFFTSGTPSDQSRGWTVTAEIHWPRRNHPDYTGVIPTSCLGRSREEKREDPFVPINDAGDSHR